MMTPSFLAKATLAFFRPERVAIAVAHAFRRMALLGRIMIVFAAS